MTSATVGNIDYLFISSVDSAVRICRVDGSSFTEIHKFKGAEAVRLLWLRDRSVLLVTEMNYALDSQSIRAFKFDSDLKKTIARPTVFNAEAGLWIYSWIEPGPNRITLFDGKKRELIELKVI